MKTGNGKTGRPINFGKDTALEAAMLLFLERGFEGTSMAGTPMGSVCPLATVAADEKSE
jgi:hypothetical protein